MLLRDCKFHLRGCQSPEPDLHEVLTYFYLGAFDQEEAEKLADEYLDALEEAMSITTH